MAAFLGLNLNIVLTGLVIILIMAVLVYLLRRVNYFERGEESSAADQLQREAEREQTRDLDYTLGVIARHRRYSLPAKLIFGSLGLLTMLLTVYLYLVLKGGAPVEVPYAQGMSATAVAVLGIVGGIVVRSWQDDHRGEAHITYEDGDGGERSTKTVYFDVEETDTDANGNDVIYEKRRTRLFGLFGQRKLVADDPDLRGSAPIPEDVIRHRVPQHAIWVDSSTVEWRTQGHTTHDGVDTPAHYTYRSPIELPYEEHLARHEMMAKYDQKLDSMEAKLGEAHAEIERLRRRVTEDESELLNQRVQELESIIDSLQGALPGGGNQYTIRPPGQSRSRQRALGQDEVRDGELNGEQTNVETRN